MADDLTVRFAGDTSQLNASIAAARQTLALFSSNTNQSKGSLDGLTAAFGANRNASSQASDSWRDNVSVLSDLTIIARGAVDAVEFLTTTLIDVGKVTFDAAVYSLEGINSGLNAATGSLDDYAVSSAYAERSSRLFEQAQSGIFAAIGRSIVGINRFIQVQELAFSSTARTEIGAIAAAGGLQQFSDALSRMGAGAKDTLDTFTARLMEIPDTSRDAATSIEEMFATIPNYSLEANNYLVAMVQSISKTGDEAVANAKKITGAFKDKEHGGQILGDTVSTLKDLDDIQDAVAKFSRSLDPAQAQQFFATVIGNLKAANAQQQFLVDQNDQNLQRYPLVGNQVKNIYEWMTRAAEKQQDFASSIQIATANLELQRAAAEKVAKAVEEQDKFEKLLNEDTTRTTQLEQTKKNIELLQGRQTKDVDDPGSGDLDRLARTLIGEAGSQGQTGMEAVASVIRNRAVSGYGGAKSYADVVNAPKQFSVWNPGDPAGAVANSTSTDSPVYRQAMAIVQKMVSGDLDDPTNGATSYYNPSAASPSWGRTMTNQKTIGAHVFGNTLGSPPVGDSDDQERITQRLQEQIDLRKRLTDAQAGGTEAEREQLAIAQQNAAGMHDEVAQAQALLEAKKKDLAATQGGSPSAVRAAQQAVAEAQISLAAKQAAAEKAASDLSVARAQEGSKAKLDAQIAGLDAEMAHAQGNAAKLAELEKQKVEVTREYNRQRSAAAVEVENASYDAVQRGFSQERDQINENARLGAITGVQKEAQIQASLDRQLAATQAHYAKVRAIEQQYGATSPTGDNRLAQQQAVAEDKLNADRVANARAANAAIVESYKSSMESIGSTVATSLEAILERTGRLRDLLRNVATNISSQFLQAGLKMVADWAVNQTKTLAITVATEAQKTAAVVTGQGTQTAAVATGTAAQTGLISTASIAQAAATAAGVLRSIFAYAAQAAAGVTAFMSSFIGPAALGVGAGVEAAVVAMGTAIPSLAVGAWQLPSDTLAQLHAGEMVVPAGPAQTFRDAMAGGSGGSSSSVTHNYGDVHVNAIDAASVERWARSNGKSLMRGLAHAGHYGAALGVK